MRLSILIFLTLASLTHSFSQDVVLVKPGVTLEKVRHGVEFHLLNNNIDTTSVVFIGIFKASGVGKYSNFRNLYYLIQNKAKKSGANSFRLASFRKTDSKGFNELVLETYFTDETVLNQNANSKDKNVIFIFSSERGGLEKPTTFKLNGTNRELEGGKYLQYELREGEEVKINKGGAIGATEIFVWKKDKPATYISLTGFGVAPGATQPGTVGLSFNTGRIYSMDKSFAELMTSILERVE